jgi:hypothetical protein
MCLDLQGKGAEHRGSLQSLSTSGKNLNVEAPEGGSV